MKKINLKALQAMTDKAIAAARDNEDMCSEAINWGDLSCFRAERCEDQDGHIMHRVWIEEASPDATLLQDFVGYQLATAGFGQVEVITEW